MRKKYSKILERFVKVCTCKTSPGGGGGGFFVLCCAVHECIISMLFPLHTAHCCILYDSYLAMDG